MGMQGTEQGERERASKEEMCNENLRPRPSDRHEGRTCTAAPHPFPSQRWISVQHYGLVRSSAVRPSVKEVCQCEEVLLLWTGCVPPPTGARLSVKEEEKEAASSNPAFYAIRHHRNFSLALAFALFWLFGGAFFFLSADTPPQPRPPLSGAKGFRVQQPAFGASHSPTPSSPSFHSRRRAQCPGGSHHTATPHLHV